ncbi:2-hydroxychromene-2-carboxylate isomerase [Oceanimonas sp. MB9]|uniref:2-hydroxychromene-2-carboxylate isomerase n=1 Tax=Oceanimonas sp. MB9 TaxID=2588453 RepID=UPI0013F65E36|nr:2-hydroxychromene-2-carboxylate isomerase [Oceanimonas sp. MB9]NHI00464.1 2-hydroxychromene-2-carboxylate isomerase [Oceanimonas sp. MB9]
MTTTIDYYFTSISPFTYLGHRTFLDIAGQAQVNFKPVRLPRVFANSGAVPLAERPQCRQRYRLLEIERWAKKRGLPVNLQPAHFPTDPSLADRCVIALQQAGHHPGEFLARVLAACWAEEKDIADASVITAILVDLKLDADALLKAARSPATEQQYDRNTDDALGQGILGAPSWVLDNEQFWGQDRLELLADTLDAVEA